jgi:hypothetical protein
VVFVLLAYVGFWRHITAFGSTQGPTEHMPDYSSYASWLGAVVINGYGVRVFAIGLFIAWKLFYKNY